MHKGGIILPFALSLAFILICIGGIVGGGFAIARGVREYANCYIVEVSVRNCTEYDGSYYIRQLFTMDSGSIAYYDCGSVSDCNADICRKNIRTGYTYACNRIQEDLYDLGEPNPVWLFFVGAIAIALGFGWACITIYCLFSSCMNNKTEMQTNIDQEQPNKTEISDNQTPEQIDQDGMHVINLTETDNTSQIAMDSSSQKI